MKTFSSWGLTAFLLLASGRVLWAHEAEGAPSQPVEQATQPATCPQSGAGRALEDGSGFAGGDESEENPLGQYFLWHRYGVANWREAEQDGPT